MQAYRHRGGIPASKIAIESSTPVKHIGHVCDASDVPRRDVAIEAFCPIKHVGHVSDVTRKGLNESRETGEQMIGWVRLKRT